MPVSGRMCIATGQDHAKASQAPEVYNGTQEIAPASKKEQRRHRRKGGPGLCPALPFPSKTLVYARYNPSFGVIHCTEAGESELMPGTTVKIQSYAPTYDHDLRTSFVYSCVLLCTPSAALGTAFGRSIASSPTSCSSSTADADISGEKVLPAQVTRTLSHASTEALRQAPCPRLVSCKQTPLERLRLECSRARRVPETGWGGAYS